MRKSPTRVHCSEDKASVNGTTALPTELNGAPVLMFKFNFFFKLWVKVYKIGRDWSQDSRRDSRLSIWSSFKIPKSVFSCFVVVYRQNNKVHRDEYAEVIIEGKEILKYTLQHISKQKHWLCLMSFSQSWPWIQQTQEWCVHGQVKTTSCVLQLKSWDLGGI